MSLEADVELRLGQLDLSVELTVSEHEVVALLGPNGAGKTTLLRALSGLLPIDRGTVTLDGRLLEDPARRVRLPPEQRPMGVVFQDYLLFPHLNVAENVAFGLRSRGVGRGDARERAHSWLARMGLESYAQAKPSALSAGQRQRVALARALATDPRLLLLDEPLAALDASTRAEIRRDLRRHLESFRGIRILITHDPLEAVALARRLVVLEEGRIVQSGTPEEVTSKPRSRYVADLVGVNLLHGNARGHTVDLKGGGTLTSAEEATGEVFVVIHPRSVAVHRARPMGSPRNVWPGDADSLDLEADRVRVGVVGTPSIVAEVTPASMHELHLARGGRVWVSVKATEVSVYSA